MHQKCLWLFCHLFLHQLIGSSALKGPPKLHPKVTRLITAEEGDVVKLPCPISAKPEPLFEWRKDGRPLDGTWSRYILRKHLLRIKSARKQDEGEFTCTGVNGFGQVSFTFSLHVYGEGLPPMESRTAPKLTDISPLGSPFVTKVGATLTLVCRAYGVPQPKIVWSKDSLPLHKSGSKLHVQIRSLLDSGQYSCTATNPMGIASHNFSIIIEEKSSEEPQILQATNTTVMEGANTTLQCLVKTYLLPEIQWLKLVTPSEVAVLPSSVLLNNTLHRDGRTYRYVSNPGSRMERENGTYMSKLFIGNASPMDAGVYVCVGATEKGYNYKQVHLVVLPGPRQAVAPKVEVNLLMIILPLVALVVIAFVVVIVCKTTRRSTTEKRHQSGAQNTSLESEDPTSNTPLNSYKQQKGGTNLPPDLVYQDGNNYATHLSNMGPMNGSVRYPDPYIYPENSYLDPNYSDPYLEPHEPPPTQQQQSSGKGFEPRGGSDHSYARLTQSTQSSTSPLPPPPYAYQLPFSATPTPRELPFSTTSTTPHSHSLSHHNIHQVNAPFSYTSPHQHRDTKYVVHYNL